MSQVYDTKLDDAWLSDVLARLPADLEQTAREYGAFTRVRAFAKPSDLLRGLLAYACSLGSLRSLGAWGVLTDVADIAHTSWLERLRACAPWLQSLVAQQLAQPRPRWLDQRVRGRVLLIDATCLGWLGGTGNDQRLHLAYDLLHGQIAQLISTDGHAAEHVRQFTLLPGDLLILDGGYGYRDRVGHVQDQLGDVVVRIYPPTFPLEHADGRRFDMRAWLDGYGSDHRTHLVYYRHGGQRRAVRLLAARLSEARRQQAHKRANKRAQKRMRPLSEVTAYYADWMVIVTTLLDEQSWPERMVWQLYRARWQIELLFKGLKQFLDIGKVRVRTMASALAVVWARVLVWVMHEGVVGKMRRVLGELAQPHPTTYPEAWPEAEGVVSEWHCHELVLASLLGAIRGQWSLARIEACLPRLVRFLVSHPRDDRHHQASEVRALLSGQRLTRPKLLPNHQ